MIKRILVTSTDVMMYQFLLPHINYLSDNGFEIDVVCSHANLYEKEGYHDFIKKNIPSTSQFFSVDLCRSPYSLKNKKGLKQLKKIINENHYDLIWTNEPVMGVMTRIAAKQSRKNGTKVLYLAHGYHFYKNCPKKNWLYYFVEKVMSKKTDYIVLINWEDYNFTKKHFKVRGIFHIDGIGLNTQKFRNVDININKKRNELDVNDDDILLLSVGELQKRKNHEVIIDALSKIKNGKIKYVICGCGELQNYYERKIKKLKLSNNVFLLGHRYDVNEILKCADIFVHPSIREGLGIAAIEAMASGLPLVTSDIQGIKDYMENGKTGYMCHPYDVNGFINAINHLVNDKELREKMSTYNIQISQKYELINSMKSMLDIIKTIL